MVNQKKWDTLTIEEKNQELYLQQVETLRLFLERNAISKEQHDKSLKDLREKMNIDI